MLLDSEESKQLEERVGPIEIIEKEEREAARMDVLISLGIIIAASNFTYLMYSCSQNY